VVDGVKNTDGLIVYLGVVPAAVSRAHPVAHEESRMHGGRPDTTYHDKHFVVALFDRSSGRRISEANVFAELFTGGRRVQSVPLRRMTINSQLTFGGYTTLDTKRDYTISVHVARPRRVSHTIARFDYVHD
jgi:hypothetical protein